MSFGAEMKDFAAGFSTGFSLRDKAKDRKQREELFNAKQRGVDTKTSHDMENTDLSGSGADTSVHTPRAPKGDGTDAGSGYDTGDATANNVLAFVRKREAGTKDPYNTVLGGKTEDLSNMTIAQVQDYQKNMIASGRESSAVGAYQFIMPTLAATVKQLGLDPTKTKFTPEIQDKLGYQLLKNRGWGDPKVSREKLMHNLSQEWASLPKDASGKSFYEGVGSNHSGSTWKEFNAAFDAPAATEPAQAGTVATAIPTGTKALPTTTAANNAGALGTRAGFTTNSDGSVASDGSDNPYNPNYVPADEGQDPIDPDEPDQPQGMAEGGAVESKSSWMPKVYKDRRKAAQEGAQLFDNSSGEAPEVETVSWHTEGYAAGGAVVPDNMRVFTQPVDADPAAKTSAIPLPRQIDFAAARAPVTNPSAGVQQAFRDRMAASRARLATPAAAPAAAAPATPLPADEAAYVRDQSAYVAERQRGLRDLRSKAQGDELMGGKEQYRTVQPYMSYDQYSQTRNPRYQAGVTPNAPAAALDTSGFGADPFAADPRAARRAQITAASRASMGFAKGGAVEKKDEPKEAIPTGQLVSAKDYGKLSPGAAPVREGTAALWRLDAQAQQRAQERLHKRDQTYHEAKPATGGGGTGGGGTGGGGTGGGGTGGGGGGSTTTRAAPVRKRKEPDDATGTTDAQTESTVEAYPGSAAPEVTPETSTEAYPGSKPPEQAIPVKPQDAPQVDPRPQSPPTLARGTIQEVQVFNPHTGKMETRQQPTSPAATPPTAAPEYGPGGPGGYTPAAPDNRKPPAAIDRAGNPTGATPPPPLPTVEPIPPSLPLPNSSGAPSPGSAPPAPPPPVAQRPLATPPTVPPTLPVPGAGAPSPGSAIPLPQQGPPIPQPPRTGLTGAAAADVPPSTPNVKAIQGPPGAAAQPDIGPEPWIPQNVPENAKGTLSQAWQYGRGLIHADPEQRPQYEKLFNNTLLQAMKLGTPHSVIAAYADNFGVAAPARPKAIGFAAGGPVPDEEDYTPANQQAAANDQPVIPDDGGGNLRAATPEAEATAKGKPIVTREEVKESTKAGLKYINDNILSPQRKTAVGADPAAQGAQQKFDTNDHALTGEEMKHLTQQVDPDDKLSQSQKILKAQSDMYDFYMAHGYPEKAAGAAASVMMYGRRVSQISGTMAQAALESGRPDALVQASKFMAKAYENMPNGHELKVEPQPGQDGKVGYEVVDENGNTVEQGRAGPDEMMTMAKKMSNGQAWAAETFRLAQETGMDATGTGRGKRGTGPTYSQQTNEERKGLSKAAAEAGKAFKSDPSDENRQKYEDAKAAALAGGVSGGAMTGLDKIYAPAAPKQTGTAGERADAEADKALETQTGEIDKQIESETDPAKQLELKKQRALLPLDDGYNRALTKIKSRVDSKGLDEALDQLEIPEGPDRVAVSRFSKDLQRANNLAIGDAAQVIKAALDPNETFRINGNQVMIGDQSYFLSGPLYRGLMGIRNSKKNATPAAAPAAAPAQPAAAATG